MADDVALVSVTTASSNAIVVSNAIRIHKVVLQNSNGSNAVSALLYDSASAAGTAIIGLITSYQGAVASFELYKEANFDPPVFCQKGLSTTLAGSNVTCRIYYTRV
jgi:hypothetical protein